MSSLGLEIPTLVLGRAQGHEEADELRMTANFWCIATASLKQMHASGRTKCQTQLEV